jgi:hypothetical protein
LSVEAHIDAFLAVSSPTMTKIFAVIVKEPPYKFLANSKLSFPLQESPRLWVSVKMPSGFAVLLVESGGLFVEVLSFLQPVAMMPKERTQIARQVMREGRPACVGADIAIFLS